MVTLQNVWNDELLDYSIEWKTSCTKRKCEPT